jgi:hypothetical protein
VTTQRSWQRALTLVVVIGHAACGGSKSEDKPPPSKSDGGSGPIAPPIAVPKSGVDRIERMNFQWGSVGSRDYAKALIAYAAKGKPRDWNAIKSHAEAALSKDAQHLGAHWLLAAALSQLGDHAAVVDHLVFAIAADFYNYGIKFATSEDLKPFLATQHGASVQELAAKIREDYKQRVANAMFVVGRRSPFRWPEKASSHESSSRGELYAYDRETRQYLRLTHTNDTVVGYVRPAAGTELAILTYDRMDRAKDEAPIITRASVQLLDTGEFRASAKATIEEPTREIGLGYTDDRLLVTTAPAQGRWGLGATTVWSFDKAKGKLSKATVSSPLPRIAFTLEEGRLIRVPEGVKAAWAGDPPVAPSLEVGGKAIVPKDSGSATQTGVALAPKHLAYTTAVDPCATAPSLYVVDLDKGAHIHVLSGRSQFAPRWLDPLTLAYEDGEGSIRLWDAASSKQLPNPLVNRAGIAFDVLTLGVPCKQGADVPVGVGSGSAVGSGSDDEPPLPPED